MGLFTTDNTAATEECVAILQAHSARFPLAPHQDALIARTMGELIVAMEPFDLKGDTRDNFQKMVRKLLANGNTERAIKAMNSVGGVSIRNWVPPVVWVIVRAGQFALFVLLLGLAIMVLRWAGVL